MLVILSTLLTIAVNYGLSTLIKNLTRQERHLSRTNYILSLIIKTVISQFINTAVLYYVMSRILNDSFTSKVGLVLQVTSLFLISGGFNIFLNLLNLKAMWRSLKLFCKYRNLAPEDTV